MIIMSLTCNYEKLLKNAEKNALKRQKTLTNNGKTDINVYRRFKEDVLN